MIKKITFLMLLISGFTFSGCTKDGDSDIDTYIAKKGLKTTVTPEGLHFIIDVPGDQTKKPKISSKVLVKYVGKLLNDDVFDSSVGQGAEFRLGNVILGWQIGMQLFGKGGKGKLIVPPSIGYGGECVGTIPANSALAFDVELVDIIN